MNLPDSIRELERLRAKWRSTSAVRGFTLIELVTTMIVIGILAVFALGRLDFTSTFDQRGVYDKVKAGLEFARKAAVAKRRFVQVTVGGGSVSFLYDGNKPENAARDFAAANTLALPVTDRDCGAGIGNAVCSHRSGVIGLVSGGSPFTFDAQGAASATVVLSVAGQSNITVEAQTGYVH